MEIEQIQQIINAFCATQQWPIVFLVVLQMFAISAEAINS